MNFNELAAKVTAFITPFLPYLIIGGESMAKELGQQFGQTIFTKAQLLWSKLKNALDDSVFKNATMAFVENPQSTSFQLALATALVSYLEKHPGETTQIESLMAEGEIIQFILVEREGEVDNILQELKKTGGRQVQSGVVRGKVGNFTQKQ